MDWANGRNIGVSGLRRTGRTVRQTRRTPSYWAEYRTRADGTDWRIGGSSGVRNPGLDGLGPTERTQRTQRTTES